MNTQEFFKKRCYCKNLLDEGWGKLPRPIECLYCKLWREYKNEVYDV